MKTFETYINELALDQTGRMKAAMGMAKTLAGAAMPNMVQAPLALKQAWNIAKQALKDGRRAEALKQIRQSMEQADSSRGDDNPFDLDDHIAAMLSDKAKDDIGDLVFKGAMGFAHDPASIPLGFANRIAIDYIRKVISV